MTTERDLIQRLAKELDTWLMAHHYGGVPPEIHYAATLVAEARALLSQPESEGPALEPRGCPTPGACSCPTSPTVPPDLIRALELAETALADSGDQDLPRIRAALARWGRPAVEPEPPGLPPDYIDSEHTGNDREVLEVFYRACLSEGGSVDEVHLRGLKAVIALSQAEPETNGTA